jgi:uncharacterized membrane protein
MDASVICRKIPPMKLAPILALSLAVAGCGRPASQAAAPTAPAAGPAARPGNTMDISHPIFANGTEPFWALTIDGQRFRLSRPGQPDLVATAPGAAITSGRATWVAMAPGAQMTVTLYASDCSDGMSDRRYPMAAEVVVLNETLRGCAARTADVAR